MRSIFPLFRGDLNLACRFHCDQNSVAELGLLNRRERTLSHLLGGCEINIWQGEIISSAEDLRAQQFHADLLNKLCECLVVSLRRGHCGSIGRPTVVALHPTTSNAR